jgi:xanthine dehydrogenase accessory factor
VAHGVTPKACQGAGGARETIRGYSTTVETKKETHMRDILHDLDNWQAEDKSIALATVIQTWGSSPRRAGAKMALTPDGKITGSVSGGCVEGAVYETGVDVLKSNRPQLLHFGVADETAWEVGLACGGSIDIFVKPLDAKFFKNLRSAFVEERSAVVVTLVRGPNELMGHEMLVEENGKITGTLNDELDQQALEAAKETLVQGASRRVMLNDDIEVFMEVILPPPTLVAVGGVHITIALMALAKTLGYRTVVVDPRSAFGNEERFPNVDQLIKAWPDEAFQEIPITRSTAIAMLTHDPKLDDPALKIALSSPAFYVGALGSKTTQAKRRQRLLDEGLTEVQLNRLHGPIGLEIGAGTPEEIAMSIMAEIVAAWNNAEKEAGSYGKSLQLKEHG